MIVDFLTVSAIGFGMIFLTSLILYEIFRVVWVVLPKLKVPARLRVVLVILPIFFAHILNIWLYALAYFLIQHFTPLGGVIGDTSVPMANWTTFVDCLYFSSATYSTLGYGDVIATDNLRMLTVTEALNGLILIGWTISFTYLVMEDFWKIPDARGGKR